MSNLVGDPLQRFATGDPIGKLRADTMNALVDAAKQVRRQFAVGVVGGNKIEPDRPGTLEILVRNDTTIDRSQYSILELTEPLIGINADPTALNREPAFAGVAPTSASACVCVTLEPIPYGATGRAILVGPALVRLSVTSSGDTFCSPVAGNANRLTTGASGALKIIWKESGTGDKWGLVLLQGADSALATRNLNNTQVGTTSDMRFDQSTHISITQGSTFDTVAIDVDSLASDPGFVTQFIAVAGVEISLVECVSLITNPDGSYSLQVKKRVVKVLSVGPEQDCILNPPECCPPATVEVPCCPDPIPEELILTVSGGGGDYPATWDGTGWATGVITIPGCGTANLRLECAGSPAAFVVGTVPGSQCTWATDLLGPTVTCNPFSAQFNGAFSGIGCSCTTKTLTWTPAP